MHEDVVRALDIPRKREIFDVSTIDFRELLVGKISNPTLLQTLDRLVKERSNIDGGPTSNRATAPGCSVYRNDVLASAVRIDLRVRDIIIIDDGTQFVPPRSWHVCSVWPCHESKQK